MNWTWQREHWWVTEQAESRLTSRRGEQLPMMAFTDETVDRWVLRQVLTQTQPVVQIRNATHEVQIQTQKSGFRKVVLGQNLRGGQRDQASGYQGKNLNPQRGQGNSGGRVIRETAEWQGPVNRNESEVALDKRLHMGHMESQVDLQLSGEAQLDCHGVHQLGDRKWSHKPWHQLPALQAKKKTHSR